MDDNEDSILVTQNLTCSVCGNRQFDIRHGYYFCQECGTKQQQMRQVQVDPDNQDFGQLAHKAKKTKIQKTTEEKPKLTSWECYNFILRGLVEELLALGAKEELKLMALQLWAAYLRKLEVAFFNKKHSELPRLGVYFKRADANTLYNHAEIKARKRKRRRSEVSNSTNEQSSFREKRKSKRKLDESAYSELSGNAGSASLSSYLSTSLSGTSSTHALQLKFSTKARNFYKKTMPAKHLEKHAMDSEGLLKCHSMHPKRKTLNHNTYELHNLNLRQIYGILAIALNLIEDDIQLSDFARFTAEEHISNKKVVQYFPANLEPHVRSLLKNINFYDYSDKTTDKVLRGHVLYLSKFLHVRSFKQPNLLKLARRYITELQLPTELATYVQRLINFLPPQMKTNVPHTYPEYEARAMAYIIFVLKLLFGLDDHKEHLMSRSAMLLNAHIERNDNDSQQPKLFVWQQWQQYVEMRKIILSQHSSIFCRQYEQKQSMTTLLNELAVQQKIMENEQDPLSTRHKAFEKELNMKRIFERQLSTAAETVETYPLIITPSLTPAHDNFKRLKNSIAEKIPLYMHTDHTVRTLIPLLKAKALRDYFHKKHNCQLKVLRLPCTASRRFVGYFRTRCYEFRRTAHLKTQKADFNITEAEWLENIEKEESDEILEFKTVYDTYGKLYLRNMLAKPSLVKHETSHSKSMSAAESQPTQQKEERQLEQHSMQLFSENDMEPLSNVELNTIRQELEDVRLFTELSSSDEDENASDDDDEDDVTTVNDKDLETAHLLIKQEEAQTWPAANESKQLTFLSSKMDLWLLLGLTTYFTDAQKKILQSKLPRSFFWLLQTCAQTLGIEWVVLYEQLLAIEVMFTYGIDKLDKFENCLYFRYNNPIKDINKLTKSYRDIW